MRGLMKLVMLLAFGVLFSFLCLGQHLETGTASKLAEGELLYHYEVKIIDEFMERFNDDKNSYIRSVYTEKNIPFNFSRQKLISTLFNLSNPKIATDTVTMFSFIRDVTDKQHPVILHFVDSNWYAQADVTFRVNNKSFVVPFILYIKSHGNDWSKWMIAGVGDIKPVKDKPNIEIVKSEMSAAPTYIPTSAYGNDFVVLDCIFSAPIKQSDFFDSDCMKTNNYKKLLAMIGQKKAEFLFVDNISFFFFQPKDWVFEVEQFNRKDINSGWLINRLQKMQPAEKSAYLTNLLHHNDAHN
jgi:hypothetical protein